MYHATTPLQRLLPDSSEGAKRLRPSDFLERVPSADVGERRSDTLLLVGGGEWYAAVTGLTVFFRFALLRGRATLHSGCLQGLMWLLRDGPGH